MLSVNQVHQGDCLDLMKEIADQSIDMILCDLPYGITDCKWDSVSPFESLWAQYDRIIKPNAAIVLFGTEPFSSALRYSNIKMYRYDWYWVKNTPTGAAFAKKQPMRAIEILSVFYRKQPTYNPQMVERTESELKRFSYKSQTTQPPKMFNTLSYAKTQNRFDNKLKYPKNILNFKCVFNRSKEKTIHPTQKPVALCEYLIKVYTNEGDVVLDNCAGSGTTGVAALSTNRNYILIEKEEKYCEVARKRLQEVMFSNGLTRWGLSPIWL